VEQDNAAKARERGAGRSPELPENGAYMMHKRMAEIVREGTPYQRALANAKQLGRPLPTTTLVLSDERVGKHETGPNHQENRFVVLLFQSSASRRLSPQCRV
jgi:hypothetical protein